ncbi:ribose-phosphate pyrophosphokinase [Erythrobacter sp. W53]|uniref:ribose-phosphate pyrophosphokinase n=1 Tax=Erythrobacter sp. W53 TaxID=3425947 RepID=UPI003D768944
MPSSPSFDRTVSEWLEAEGIVEPASPGDIADTASVRELLIAAAKDERAISYSEMLGLLGHRFTRPKMRALCKTLDAIDADGAAAGEPELAVLVVRESDRLPGQGWWVGVAQRHGYKGQWEGIPAAEFVERIQHEAFDFWKKAKPPGST